ncbi:hypothetical protein HanXRQr2_Chr13g0604991 [Helianthus annuus]|uniref:Uncharacterized protein n=1 Tax=Helianthus annuus TaxID=4232 RepID=A0A9K3EL72_HELAN|nr:hypothetical protein HanXRQr2_Chr13g0604991 [Helianthus annuus]KAJ0478074.1 hypothetical protein HanHA300_Chr13g0496071 [Helianthus annuus]KAJ0498952.1 hypothetical protein HanHA89_Chr13g0528711 [Helianthus annuus]KAJ0664967.1 hypothetical protein HanLR1_Chr13g0498741 [Helianthus annuus]KAJ0850626.1 hypothetical protein HanPSC8_Chr13g0583001 [Helianthus annuus]
MHLTWDSDVISLNGMGFLKIELSPAIKYVFIVCRANDNGQVLNACGVVTHMPQKKSSVMKR